MNTNSICFQNGRWFLKEIAAKLGDLFYLLSIWGTGEYKISGKEITTAIGLGIIDFCRYFPCFTCCRDNHGSLFYLQRRDCSVFGGCYKSLALIPHMPYCPVVLRNIWLHFLYYRPRSCIILLHCSSAYAAQSL